MTVLAGDIGGTNARLAIFDAGAGRRRSARALYEQTYPLARRTRRWTSSSRSSCRGRRQGRRRRPDVTSACLGIAGPIENNMCRATNLPWVVDGRTLAQRLGIAARHAGQRLLRGGAGRHRRRVPINWWRWAAARRCRRDRSPCWARGRASARLFCSGRPPRTPTRWSPPRAATSIWRRARRSSWGWSSSSSPSTAASPASGCSRATAWSTCSRFSPRSRPAAGLIRPETTAALAAPGERSGGRDLAAGDGRDRSGLRDGAVNLLFGAGRDGRKPGPHGARHGRRLRRGRRSRRGS